MFVTGSAESFVAGAATCLVLGNAINLVVFDSCGSGGAGNLLSEVTVYLVVVVGFSFVAVGHFVAECLECFTEIVFDGHHPSPALYFCKWGSSVPIHISLPLELWQHLGLFVLGDVALSLWGNLK